MRAVRLRSFWVALIPAWIIGWSAAAMADGESDGQGGRGAIQAQPETTLVLPATRPGPTLLAKKKKKKKDDDNFGPDGIDAVTTDDQDKGAGIHREQMGVDKPYFNEISGSTALSFDSVQVGSGSANPSQQIDVGGAFLFIFGHVEIGPEVHYDSSTTTTSVSTVDGAGNSATTTTKTSLQTYSVGPLVKVNFGNIDRATLVPFALAGVAYRGGSTQSGSDKAETTSGYGFRVGGGLNIFLSSNVTFQPELEYHSESDKPDSSSSASDQTTTSSGIHLVVGIGTFL